MNNIAPKLQIFWTDKIAFKIISKMLKQPNFFDSQPPTLPKDAPATFQLSKTFGLSFVIRSVARTRSSTSSAYIITKIGNRNLNCGLPAWCVEFQTLKVVRNKKLKLLTIDNFFSCHLIVMKFSAFTELANT